MCTPNPTVAIVTFWQGIVEIILRVAVIVSSVIFACQWSTLLFLQLYLTRARGGYGSREILHLFSRSACSSLNYLCTCQVATLIPMLLGARLTSSYAYFYRSVFAHVSLSKYANVGKYASVIRYVSVSKSRERSKLLSRMHAARVQGTSWIIILL